jgi:hypothetical protein
MLKSIFTAILSSIFSLFGLHQSISYHPCYPVSGGRLMNMVAFVPTNLDSEESWTAPPLIRLTLTIFRRLIFVASVFRERIGGALSRRCLIRLSIAYVGTLAQASPNR